MSKGIEMPQLLFVFGFVFAFNTAQAQMQPCNHMPTITCEPGTIQECVEGYWQCESQPRLSCYGIATLTCADGFYVACNHNTGHYECAEANDPLSAQ